jgi:short-subunit dehydrogenase
LEAPTQIFDFTTNEHLQVDVLVNNAGAGLGGDFADTDIQRQLEIIQLNISALTHLTYLFLPAMIKRRAGWIMNVASTAAFQPGPFMAVYYASKAYVLSFSQAIAEELRKTGVTVSALCPGPTESEFAKTAHIGKTRLFRAKAAASAADVAEYGYAALMSGKRVAIPGTMNKLVAQANRVAPRILATKISRMLQEPL